MVDEFVPDLPSTGKNPFNQPNEIRASAKELQFREKFYELNGNRTLAAKLIFDCQDDRSAAAIGSRLCKKFGLQKPQLEPKKTFDDSGFNTDKLKTMGINSGQEVVPEPSKLSHGGMHGRLEVLSDALSSGELSFRDMFNEMRAIAYCYRDKSVSIRALVQLKDWWDEAKQQRDKLEMAERDIVDVLSRALASIGRGAYIEVLKINRRIRRDLIHERNRRIDVEAIIRDEQEKKLRPEEVITSYADVSRPNAGEVDTEGGS